MNQLTKPNAKHAVLIQKWSDGKTSVHLPGTTLEQIQAFGKGRVPAGDPIERQVPERDLSIRYIEAGSGMWWQPPSSFFN
jgi:hypothetical protein